MFKLNFLGNTRVPHHKNTADTAPIVMTAPAEIIIPMDQHIGAPATPVVKVGDSVKVGQLIAEATGYISSPIYSSVSGKVTKIESYLRTTGRTVTAIKIESDGLMTEYENITPPQITDIDSLISAIKDSGVVGLGGAGFPTAVKFDAVKKGGINTLIINAAECEPYITSDARTMLDDSELLYEGITLIQRIIPDIKKYIIGIENNKPQCIAKMKKVFEGNPSLSVFSLPSRYPQGAEKVLIRNTTGLTVPEGKLPADVGVIVINVTTLAAIARYVKTGMPLVKKCITVDGSAIKEPKNVIAPIGASIRDIIDFVGGFKEDPAKIIFGGPMTGWAACSLDEPISKNTNALLAFAAKDTIAREPSACIHCGRCVEACPHHLNPTAFSKSLEIENVDERMAALEAYSVTLCMDCGCCSYVCPASRPLVENNRIAKNALREYKAHKATLK